MKKIGDFFTGAYDYVVGLFIGDEDATKFSDVFDKITDILEVPMKKIKGFFTGAYDYVVGLFGGGEDAGEGGKGIVPSISDMFGGVADMFTFVSEKIGEFFTKAKDWVLDNLPSVDDLINLFPVVGKIMRWWKGDDKEEENTTVVAAVEPAEIEFWKIKARAESIYLQRLNQMEDAGINAKTIADLKKEGPESERFISSAKKQIKKEQVIKLEKAADTKTPKVIKLEKAAETERGKTLKTLSDKTKTATDASSTIIGGSTVVNQSTGGSTSNTTVVNNNAGNNDSLRALERSFSPSVNRQLCAI